jgi:hypothetical protein
MIVGKRVDGGQRKIRWKAAGKFEILEKEEVKATAFLGA